MFSRFLHLHKSQGTHSVAFKVKDVEGFPYQFLSDQEELSSYRSSDGQVPMKLKSWAPGKGYTIINSIVVYHCGV